MLLPSVCSLLSLSFIFQPPVPVSLSAVRLLLPTVTVSLLLPTVAGSLLLSASAHLYAAKLSFLNSGFFAVKQFLHSFILLISLHQKVLNDL